MDAISGSYFPTALALNSALLGVALHLATFHLYLDNYGWRIAGLWCFSLICAFSMLLRGNDTILAVIQTLSISTAFLLGFFGSTVLYRLLLSPIRGFPGPWQAAVTNFYRARLAIKSNIRLATDIRAMHQQYGDYVRTGPREISILNPNAIPILYGARSQCTKGPWYDHDIMMKEEDKSVFLLRDPSLHSFRRRILDRGFSSKALADYEPRIQEVVDNLIKAFDERSGTPINLTDWISYFTFDAMGRVAYNQDFGMVKRGQSIVEIDGQTTSVETLHEMIKLFGILGPVPWLIKMIIQMNLSNPLAAFHQWCHHTMKQKQQKFNSSTSHHTDMASWLVHSFIHNASSSSSSSSSSSPTKRQTHASLLSDSVLLIIAGSDTTSSAITTALYHLSRSPSALSTLRAALAALPDTSARSLASCRYLDAVLNEALRLRPPVCGALVRETPASGITVPAHGNESRGSPGGVFIPAHTLVAVPTWALHRDPRFWGPDADAFRPERFAELGIDVTDERAPFAPFSRGAYACAGKAVAYAEMRAVVAAVVTRFDVEVARAEAEADRFERGWRDTFTVTNPRLEVVLRKRVE